MITKALKTPGMAPTSAMMILLRLLTRLKRRKTRKARKTLSTLRGPESAPAEASTLMSTITKSKTFQPERQKATRKVEYMLTSSSTTKTMVKVRSIAVHTWR